LRGETETAVGRLGTRANRQALANGHGFQPLDFATGTSPERNGVSLATIESGGALHPTASGQAVLAGAVRGALARGR